MSPEDIKKRLEEAGLPGNGWQSGEARSAKSPLVEKQKESLKKLRSLLALQIDQDQEQMSKLASSLNRLKHGGGS